MTNPSLQVELVSHNPVNTISGIGRYTRELYHHLQDQLTVRIINTIKPPFSKRFKILHNFPLALEDHRSDSIVHFTQIMGCSQMLWNPVRPALATVHDLGMLAWKPESYMYNALDRWLIKLSFTGLQKMDYIIADSEYTRQTLFTKLGIPLERIRTVWLGVEHNRFHPKPDAILSLAAKYALPPKGRWIIYVGSELPRKNLSLLLKALAQSLTHLSDLHLLKVGSAGGVEFRVDVIRLIKQLGLSEKVHFYENIPDEDLPLFYSAADLFVLPSHLEGFGLPLLEAMACGLPAIASNVGSLPELGGNAVVLISPTDSQMLAKAIVNILTDPGLYAQLRANGLRQASRFSWQHTTTNTLNVYRDISTAATDSSKINRRNSLIGLNTRKGQDYNRHNEP